MKKILLSIVIAALFLSCKKESKDVPLTFTLGYKIEPLNSYITKIEYKDQTGTSVETTDISAFPGGLKTFTVSKPFNAQLKIIVNNTTTSVLNYTLSITGEGVPQKTVTLSAPALTASTEIKAEVLIN